VATLSNVNTAGYDASLALTSAAVVDSAAD